MMIKTPLIAAIFCTISLFTFAQSPTMDWVKKIGSTSDENPQACRLDNSGHVYTIGYFQGTVDFDPTAGVSNLTSNGADDVYIQKLDTMGNFIWAKSFGGPSVEIPYGIAFDANDNIHLTGYYWQTVDFDPNAGVANVTSAGSDDSFVLKLDPNGNFIWVKSFGGTSQERGYDIQVDASGNVYTTGSLFSWTADFDPGPGVFNLGIVASFCTYISKLDVNGNFVWAKQFSAGSNYIYPSALALDPQGNPIAGGRFTGSCDFNPDAGTNFLNASNQDGWVAKLSAAGAYVWARNIGAAGNEQVTGIDTDPLGNVYLTGIYSGTVDFNLGAGTAFSTSAGSNDGFVLKTNSAVDYQWHASVGGSSADALFDVAVDELGDVYASGYQNASTGLIRKWNSTGVQQWSILLGDAVVGLDVDESEYVYSTGYFTGTKNFDPNNTGFTLSSTGGRDAFVHKIVPMCIPTSITPDVASLPAQSSSCSYPNPVGMYPTATNSCGDQFTGTPNVTFPITTIGLTTITWSFSDGMGNTTTQTQAITVVDNNPIAVCMSAVVMLDQTGNGTLLLAQVENGSTDDCGIASSSLSQTAFDCLDQGDNFVTYTVTDFAGNTGTCIATVTVVDDIDPTVTPPPTIYVNCPADIPAPDVNIFTDEADNCQDPITIFFGSDVSNGQTCPETITRSYLVSDWYGNTIFVYQTIVVDDQIAPTASNPSPILVDCIGNVPAPNPSVVTTEADNCTAIPIVAFVSDVSNGLSNPETITRTYSVTDNCGNSTFVTQSILVQDLTPPTASNPASINVQCAGDIPAPDPAVVLNETDNCSSVTVTYLSQTSNGLTCPELITRTYSLTDLNGNTSTVTQTITVNDVTPPNAAPLSTLTVECSGDVPPASISTVVNPTDNCTANPVVTFDGDISNGQSCPETITRTYRITDVCGNFSLLTQTIIVDDNTAPVFANVPTAATLDCIGNLPGMTSLSWTDNCSGSGSVMGMDVSNGQTCPEIITRTWTVTDPCGNIGISTQTFTIYDQIAPIFAAAPSTVTVECDSDIPPMTSLSFSDNCGASGTVTGVDVSNGQTCPETITRTWTTTDVCGNTATSTQTIIVDDVTAPTGIGPALVNYPCHNCIPSPNTNVIMGISDNCSANPQVAFVSEISDGLSNPETLTRTYSLTDDCGNVTLIEQLITINDSEAPVPNATALADLTGECFIGAPTAPLASDNCAGTVLGTANVAFPITANGLTVITWTFDDNHGNISTQTQNAWNTPIPFNLTITNTGNVLSSNESNADYQWIDCGNGNTPIIGQISPSFVPSVNGTYSVQLSRNGCVEIAPCVVVNTIGVEENSSDLVKIFPNPAHTSIQISSPFEVVQVQLLTASGALVLESNGEEMNVEELPTGMYIVRIVTVVGEVYSKLMVE